MKISLKQNKRTFRGVFPRGEWVAVFVDLLGIPVVFCREGVDEIEFDLRSFPYDEMPMSRGMFNPVELQKKEFVYCVTGWRGDLYDEDEKPLVCTDATKTHIFNHCQDVRNFVLRCLDEMDEGRGHAIKN